MRSYIRLIAPLSILATALYLAFLASNRAASQTLPITNVDNQRTIITQPPKLQGGNLAVHKVQYRNSKDLDATASPNRP